ncbi:MAG: hypothetical protein ACI9MC_003913, partial [Kiritimatiellia bacterium]
DGQDPHYPSQFTTGKFRVTSFALTAEDTGKDFDSDGTLDNNLPNALGVVDTLLKDDDMSPEGFNARIAEAIAAHDMNILLQTSYEDGVLTVDILAGAWDEGSQTLTVDPVSYGDDGQPTSHLLGVFSDESTFETEPASTILPVTFLPGEPPSTVPLERTQLWGTMTDESIDATVVGVIPGLRLADDVLIDLIPEEGYGNFSKEQLENLLRTMAQQEAIADIVLQGEERGISSAFDMTATSVEW